MLNLAQKGMQKQMQMAFASLCEEFDKGLQYFSSQIVTLKISCTSTRSKQNDLDTGMHMLQKFKIQLEMV